MSLGLVLLVAEALTVYGLVFAVHAIRDRFTLLPYYGLLGVLAATLRWATDAGITYQVGPFTLILGSVVFFTAILFGVFLLYLFDGVKAAQIGIYTVVAVSILSPAVAMIFYYQLSEVGADAANRIILSPIRVYVASTAAMIFDFICMAVMWEMFGRFGQRIPLLLRIATCLLTAYQLDALVFTTGAFVGEPAYASILTGNLISRIVLTAFVAPIVTMYVVWESRRQHHEFSPRQLMALLYESARTELDLSVARLEIEERKRIEEELRRRDAILGLLAYASEHFLNRGRDAISMPEMLRALGNAVGVARVFISEHEIDEDGVRRLFERVSWSASDDEAAAPHWSGRTYEEAGLSRWEAQLAVGGVIAGDLRDLPSSERQVLAARGVSSILVLPVFVQEIWWGLIGFEECAGRRAWPQSEIDALRTAAGTFGAAMHRARIEEELRDSTERLDLALEGGDLGLWDWDIENDQVVFNERWAKMLGYPLSAIEPTSRAWENLIHPEDMPRLRSTMRAHLKGETPYFELEVRMRSSNQQWHWILSKGKVVSRDESGWAHRATGTHLDITLRKESEQAILDARVYEREIETRIEETLLRGRPPARFEGADIAALTVPKQHMDGDFTEFIPLNPECFDLIVGDVMGKGIFAALVSAGAKSRFLHALTSQLAAAPNAGYPSPASLVGAVHVGITHQLIELDCFLTLCYARFDLKNGSVTYVDCGHTKTIRYRVPENQFTLLEGRNVPIGFLESEVYSEECTDLRPGDIFLFYSDGLTETRDAEGSQFGVERLMESLRIHGSLDAAALTEKIVELVGQFSGDLPPSDDQTCVAVKILDPGVLAPRAAIYLEITANPSNLVVARTFLQQHLHDNATLLGGEEEFNRIVLAFVEAISNIIKHAFNGDSEAPITIELRCSRNRLAIDITHAGGSFKPRSTPLPDPRRRQEGGYGLYIMNRCFDEIAYDTTGSGLQCITLVKHFSSRWQSLGPESE